MLSLFGEGEWAFQFNSLVICLQYKVRPCLYGRASRRLLPQDLPVILRYPHSLGYARLNMGTYSLKHSSKANSGLDVDLILGSDRLDNFLPQGREELLLLLIIRLIPPVFI